MQQRSNRRQRNAFGHGIRIHLPFRILKWPLLVMNLCPKHLSFKNRIKTVTLG